MSTFTDDEIRAQLRAQKIPEHMVERAVAANQAGRYVRNADVRAVQCSEAEDARLEKVVVAEADKQLRALGFRVINTSQPRHAKYITPGVPDRFYFHRARGLGFAWEAKTATGEQSAAQRDFQEDCDACGWPYVLGTDQQLYDWLLARYPLVRDEQGHLTWRGE